MSFGDRLRQAREKKGISLDDIAQITKIGTRQLAAMEAEEFDKLPGGIFNKGFVRSYARCVGLNEDEAVAEYLEAIQESPVAFKADIAVTEFPPEREPVERADRGGPRLIPVLVGLAILALILAGVVWWRITHSTREPVAAPTSSVVTPPISAPASAPQPQPSGSDGAASAGASTSQPPANTNPAPVTTTQAIGQPTASATTANSTKEPATPDDSATSEGFAVRVAAHKSSWMKVQTDDAPAKEVTLTAKGSTVFRAKSTMRLRLGNTGGVSVWFNRKQLDLQGVEGEARTLNFYSSGLR